MADTVENILQDMVPELDDLRRKRIFDDEEIRQIVRRRRDFEYMLQKNPSKPQDYLGYVRYEVALECLRARRSKALHWRRKTLSDFAGIRRLHFIFTRGVRKFRADKRFWYQYVDFCLRSGSTRILSKTLLRALKFHPREVSLWLLAADRELKCGHIKAARALLLRGLRMAPRSAKLWGEVLRLEVRLACHLQVVRGTAEVSQEPPLQSPWSPACLVLRRAQKRLAGSAQALASFLVAASGCQEEARRALPGEGVLAQFTAELRVVVAEARLGAGSDAPAEALTAIWELWWRQEREDGSAWPTIAGAAAAAAPPAVLRQLALLLAEESSAPQRIEGEGPVAALLKLAAAPQAATDAEVALAVLEALQRRAAKEEAEAGAPLEEVSRGLLQRALEVHPSCARLRLLELRQLPVGDRSAATGAFLAAGVGDLEPAVAVQLLLLAVKDGPGGGAVDEKPFDRLLQALRSDVTAAPLVEAFLTVSLSRSREAFDAACCHLEALAGRMWEKPTLRAELLATLLGVELRARAPTERHTRRLQRCFEDLLAALRDDDPEKVEWWLRYVEFSQRVACYGCGAGVPSSTDLHWRAMRSVADQALYAERAHRLLASSGVA